MRWEGRGEGNRINEVETNNWKRGKEKEWIMEGREGGRERGRGESKKREEVEEGRKG